MPLIGFSFWTLAVVALGGSCAILANMISFVMIGKINERVPENERISYFWWGTEVRKRYKQLYSESKLAFFLDLCVISILVCFVVLIRLWVFGHSSPRQ
jgi:hypothetical protein